MLSNKALLAHLNISQWTGRKLDKRATGTVEVSHATQSKVGNYTKKLLPGAKELENIQRIAGSIRQFFYDQSLPWYSDGARILPAKNYLDFTTAFRTYKTDYDQAVSAFLIEYPTLKEAARLKLGDLFSETEYPSIDYLKTAFSCEVSFMPLPDVADFRVEVLDSEKKSFLDRMKRVETDAMKDCWNRLHEVVSKAAARLSDPKAILRDSLLENVRDICSLLPKLNVTDDTALENMRLKVETIVAGISAGECRDNNNARTNAAQALDDITSKMSAFMGLG